MQESREVPDRPAARATRLVLVRLGVHPRLLVLFRERVPRRRRRGLLGLVCARLRLLRRPRLEVPPCLGGDLVGDALGVHLGEHPLGLALDQRVLAQALLPGQLQVGEGGRCRPRGSAGVEVGHAKERTGEQGINGWRGTHRTGAGTAPQGRKGQAGGDRRTGRESHSVVALPLTSA